VTFSQIIRAFGVTIGFLMGFAAKVPGISAECMEAEVDDLTGF